MLLYSTILNINDTLTKDEFLALVIKWNLESPHTANVIPELRDWKGERNKRFGGEGLWLEIEEYRNKNIIAVRYEKREPDGAVWDTDYIMNFDEMRMAIRLDRSYSEDALMEDTAFSTPHFLTLLIEGGYLKDDRGLPMMMTGLSVTEDNLALLIKVINGEAKYRFPVVYVAKTVYNRDPVNVKWLCRKLKGIAHILVESDKSLNTPKRTACKDRNEYNGGIGVYFPNGSHKRFLYRAYTGSDKIMTNKVIRSVLQYVNAQTIPPLYTWAGVKNSLLTDRLICQREERLKAENEVEKYVGAFDEDLENYERQIDDLTRKNTSLEMEVLGLRAKLNGSGSVPVLYLGEEDEFYQGEIKEMLLDAVNEILKNTPPKTRRFDVLKDVLEHNSYKNIRQKRTKQVKTMLKDYKSMTGPLRQQLADIGLKITSEENHYRLTYYGDARYNTTLVKSGGDWRDGKSLGATGGMGRIPFQIS